MRFSAGSRISVHTRHVIYHRWFLIDLIKSFYFLEYIAIPVNSVEQCRRAVTWSSFFEMTVIVFLLYVYHHVTVCFMLKHQISVCIISSRYCFYFRCIEDVYYILMCVVSLQSHFLLRFN